ncbi:galactosylgalactosylxylosylprotein 3-beta-glucuronosyltransferase 3-like [Mytilus galloprovincialis]|uniref:galactosylgalactosylxylosylprotein 3-beta-glucuronosyltransferase 3-like n=1 Tax=Mytilus galloprovincialis TaxID=29158 RepID=UPI003F7C2006
MVQIRMRKLFFFYIAISTVAFIWFYSSCGFPECKEKEIEHLIKKYKARNKELDKKISDLSQQLQGCQKNVMSSGRTEFSHSPMIYMVTPTHTHSEQKANLVRLSHTLLHVKNIHWIVVEDSVSKTVLVSKFLQNSGVKNTHLAALTPHEIKMKYNDPTWLKPKGVLQRNAALQWIRENVKPNRDGGVVYFADDDNTYSLEIFQEMRNTKKVTVWPVGLVGGLRYEKPVVKDGKVTGWFTYWKPNRPFPMDMAGFAVNVNLFFKFPDARFSNEVPRGFLESTILEQLNVKMEDLEPRAVNCSKVLVWHTRTEKTKLKNEQLMIKQHGQGSDSNIEV